MEEEFQNPALGMIGQGGYGAEAAAMTRKQQAYAIDRAALAQRGTDPRYASGAMLNTPSPAGMTDRIAQRLATIMVTLERSHNTLNEKHCALFGHPAPSGVAELRKDPSVTAPVHFEANIIAMLERVQERASDIEAAAESLSARL